MNKIATTLVASTIALSGLGLVYASSDYHEGHGYHKGKNCEHRMQKMTEKLGLSDEQATQIKAIKEKYQPQKQQLRSDMKALRASLREVMKNEPMDAARIEEIAQQMGQLKTQKIILKSKKVNEINQVLTAEQRAKKSTMFHHGGKRHHDHGEYHERGEKHDD